MRAMRMVAEELLRWYCCAGTPEVSQRSHWQLIEDLAKRSRTTKMWVDNMIKTVSDSDALCTGLMRRWLATTPGGSEAYDAKYFFASGTCKLRAIWVILPSTTWKPYAGDALRSISCKGLIWWDTLKAYGMAYGATCSSVKHSCDMGMVKLVWNGITLKPENLRTWALSLHIRSRLVRDKSASSKTAHKEEAPARISADQGDRDGLRKKMDVRIDPEKHPANIVNVVNGRIAPESVNGDRAVESGAQQMGEFEWKLPGFYDTISKKVQTRLSWRKQLM